MHAPEVFRYAEVIQIWAINVRGIVEASLLNLWIYAH